MTRTFLLFLLVATAAHAATPSAGGWIGWSYLGDGGDLPLRIWVSEGEGGMSATFDGIPWRDEWPAELSEEGDSTILTLRTPKGSKVRLAGVCDGGRWSGEVSLAAYHGNFELLYAPGLADIAPDRYADVAGYYRMSDGEVLEARRLSWGEIVVRAIRTGEQRTLLPTGPDRFMTGPARYVPSPVEARWEVVRDDAGRVAGMVRTSASGEISRGEWFALRRDDVMVVSNGDTLAATITRPDDDRDRDGVVILGGSTWETRPDCGFQTRNFAALGFAVICWDKRGFGESGGEAPVPFAATASDGVAAARLLRSQAHVDHVGYFGMSRGGWTAPIAVTQDDEAAFLILFVPPAASPAVQEQGARLARMRADGFDAATVNAARRMLDAAWRYVETGSDEDWERYASLRREAVSAGMPDDIMPPESRDPGEWAWARMNMLFDPVPYLSKVTVPVLAVFGENDLNVLTDVHRPLLEAALAATGDDDVTVVTIEGVAHDLGRHRDVPIHRFTGVGPEGFDAVMAWVRAHGF